MDSGLHVLLTAQCDSKCQYYNCFSCSSFRVSFAMHPVQGRHDLTICFPVTTAHAFTVYVCFVLCGHSLSATFLLDILDNQPIRREGHNLGIHWIGSYLLMLQIKPISKGDKKIERKHQESGDGRAEGEGACLQRTLHLPSIIFWQPLNKRRL